MEPESALFSLDGYSQCLAEIVSRPSVRYSTLSVWSMSPYTGVAEGEIVFRHGFRLRLREELDFADGLISSYGYEAYQGDKRLYRYDDFPHPHDPTLTSTHPHHKHVPPNMKRHRIPAPEIRFTGCNLLHLIAEIEALIDQTNES